METATMGRVVVTAKIENATDLVLAHHGQLAPEDVHSLEVTDALVDTGASYLCVPRKLMPKLGPLLPVSQYRARTVAGMTQMNIYGPVRLTVQGRPCTVDVAEVPDDCPVLIGQLPLENMDFIIDPKNQKLIGNPEHGGERMIELYSFLP